MLTLSSNKIFVDTRTLKGIIDKGYITSLKSKVDGEEFLQGVDTNIGAALELVYRNDESVEINEENLGTINCYQVSPYCAELRFESWDANGVVIISEDRETGDLVVEPSAYSARQGVRSVRWNLKGIREDLELVAPLFQGIRMKLDDPIIKNTRSSWPQRWEAGFAILQGKDSGFWIHTRDDRYRYKTLKIGKADDSQCLGFETEAYGPIEDNLSAGGLQWRVNVFSGDWQVPASIYRDWLWEAYNLREQESKRKEWLFGLKMAISWCPTDLAVLDVLAENVEPQKVLLHFPHWRMHGYDQNYPTYIASQEGKAFISKAQEMGFHVAPHCNAFEIDPSHRAYQYLGDFQYREIETRIRLGWSYMHQKMLQVPSSTVSLMNSQDKNTMVKIHPGLTMWHSILRENIQKAVQEHSLEAVFTDITLNTFNLHNSLVNSLTSTEGGKILTDYLGSIGSGVAIGGEGLNEITMQGLSFAQAHLFMSFTSSIEGLERTGGCALNEFLFGKLCRTMGYSRLSGNTEDEELRMRIHDEHGAIPTITIKSSDEVRNPNRAVKRVLERANS